MAFASGQRVTAAMLNRITRNDLSAVCSANLVVGAEAVITGCSMSVTTIQANTKLNISAELDTDVGSGDFLVVRLYVNGVAVSGDINRSTTGRAPSSHAWVVTVAAASTFTVELKAQKLFGAGTTTVFSTHSSLVVSGNGIS